MPIQIVNQDITKMQCDAIVSETNTNLLPTAYGVDASIHIAAGKRLLRKCKRIGSIERGEAVITRGFNLPCKYVIHTAGPPRKGDFCDNQEILLNCYKNAINLAIEAGCESIAFPLIASDGRGYPKDMVLETAIFTIDEMICEHEMTTYLVIPDKHDFEFSRNLFDDLVEYMLWMAKEKSVELYFPLEYELEEWTPPRNTQQSLMRIEEYEDDIEEEKELKQKELKQKEKHSKCICYKRDINLGDESLSKDAKYIREELQKKDKGFAETLFDFIDEKGMSDVECYKLANIDRKTFSKIKCNKDYRPSKATALSFAIALELNLKETNLLLETLGMTLSRSITFDLIVRYFIVRRIYDIHLINQTLFEFDQVLLGS